MTRQLGSVVAREVRFGEAKVGLWPLVRLTVHDVALAEPHGFQEGVAFRASSIHLDLDALALLSRRMVVRRLILEQPNAHIVIRRNGTTNLDSLVVQSPSRRESAPMDLLVQDFQVHGGQVLLDDANASRRTSFGVETKTEFSLRRGTIATRGTSEISKLAFGPLSARRVSDLNQSLAKLDWKIEHAGAFDPATRRLALERLALGLGRTELGLQGLVELGTQPFQVDLRARGARVDLAQVLDYLSAADAKALNGVHGSGELGFDLTIRGGLSPKTKPRVLGTLSVRDGAFRYAGAPVGVERAAFDVRFAPDSLMVSNFAARVAGQPLGLSLIASHFADPRVSFAVRASRLDLAAVSRWVAPKDTKLGGQADLDVRGAGRARIRARWTSRAWPGSWASPSRRRRCRRSSTASTASCASRPRAPR